MNRDILPWEKAAQESASWLPSSYLADIAKLAHEVLKLYKNDHVYSLGNSPSWIIRAAELEAEIRGIDATSGCIPFSGNFLKPSCVPKGRRFNYKEKKYWDPFPYRKTSKVPSGDGLRAYRDLLTQIGLNPQAVTDRYQASGRHSVILEFICEGSGIASFLHVMLTWAREQGNEAKLRDALRIQLYSHDIEPGKIFVKLKRFEPIGCDLLPIERHIQVGLWNCTSDVRLVPNHRPYQWASPLNPLENDHAIVDRTTQHLEYAVRANLDALGWSRDKQGFTDRKPRSPDHSRQSVRRHRHPNP